MDVCFGCKRVFPMALDGDKCPWCGLEHRTYEPDREVSDTLPDQNGLKDVEGIWNTLKKKETDKKF